MSKWFIPQLINENVTNFTDYRVGRAVTTKMKASDKFSLFIELCITILADHNKLLRFGTKNQLKQLHKMLIRSAELRNIVAHTEWAEYFDDGWFITDNKLNYQTGLYDCVMYRLRDLDLKEATEYIQYVNECVLSCLEYIDQH